MPAAQYLLMTVSTLFSPPTPYPRARSIPLILLGAWAFSCNHRPQNILSCICFSLVMRRFLWVGLRKIPEELFYADGEILFCDDGKN